ncbi:MAG: hypothetical protein M4579_000924 [Chaenotheca gracillima]|nr:MAG: hypothetical protein M4579_000924 [Chaenotheca gracillima]
MASTNKKAPTSSSPSPRESSNQPARGGARSSNSSASPAVTRTRSVRGGAGGPVSARAAAKRPPAPMSNGSNLSASQNASNPSSDVDEDDARAETTMLLDDLKSRLANAEKLSEQYQRQAEVLQARLDEALGEQGKLEERLHENDERLESLQNEQRESTRTCKDMERIYEEERVSMTQEKEDMANREEELHQVITRLKETLSQRESRLNLDDEGGRISRSSNNASPNLEAGQFAPSTELSRSSSRNNSKVLLQKDKVIESLRLELAEAQIKVVDAENSGGGRVSELERHLLETRMTNARLMEDNESFQLLLSEKTLNGDFSKADFMQSASSHSVLDEASAPSGTMSPSLADELQDASEVDSDKYRRLEAEARSMKDQNKALTLYINNIIERLLQHKDFESILDKTPGLLAGPSAASIRYAGADTDKQLPSPPSQEASGQSILQRAKSVATGANRPRPRPMSHMPPPSSASATANLPPQVREENTAIPLTRSQSVRGGHRRTNSEWAPATVVNHMYRGPPPGQTSPGVTTPRRTSFFGGFQPNNPAPSSRVTSGGSYQQTAMERNSSTASDVSDVGGGPNEDIMEVVQVPSPPHSVAGSSGAGGGSAPIAGNKLRPLRLVQENTEGASAAEEAEAAKRAKRSTWMGWFNKGKGDEVPPSSGYSG